MRITPSRALVLASLFAASCQRDPSSSGPPASAPNPPAPAPTSRTHAPSPATDPCSGPASRAGSPSPLPGAFFTARAVPAQAALILRAERRLAALAHAPEDGRTPRHLEVVLARLFANPQEAARAGLDPAKPAHASLAFQEGAGLASGPRILKIASAPPGGLRLRVVLPVAHATTARAWARALGAPMREVPAGLEGAALVPSDHPRPSGVGWRLCPGALVLELVRLWAPTAHPRKDAWQAAWRQALAHTRGRAAAPPLDETAPATVSLDARALPSLGFALGASLSQELAASLDPSQRARVAAQGIADARQCLLLLNGPPPEAALWRARVVSGKSGARIEALSVLSSHARERLGESMRSVVLPRMLPALVTSIVAVAADAAVAAQASPFFAGGAKALHERLIRCGALGLAGALFLRPSGVAALAAAAAKPGRSLPPPRTAVTYGSPTGIASSFELAPEDANAAMIAAPALEEEVRDRRTHQQRTWVTLGPPRLLRSIRGTLPASRSSPGPPLATGTILALFVAPSRRGAWPPDPNRPAASVRLRGKQIVIEAALSWLSQAYLTLDPAPHP